MPHYEMTDLLDLVLEEGASDLHIHTLAPPVLRIHGEMTQLDGPALTPEDSEYQFSVENGLERRRNTEKNTRTGKKEVD